MTKGSGERSYWIAAVALSAAVHVLLAVVIPGIPLLPETVPIMKIRLAVPEQKSVPDPVPAPAKKNNPTPEKVKPDVARLKKTPATKPVSKATPEPVIETPAADEVQLDGEAGAAASDQPSSASPQAGGAAFVGVSSQQKVAELKALEIIKKVVPDYSTFSRKRKEEGTVTIIAKVFEGRVVSAEIERSSGYERLDESALRAVKQWIFKNIGEIRVRVPVTFRLK